jgi:predicted GNAT superfamily acetyltransferase
MPNHDQDDPPVEIRALRTADAMREVETLQREVWGFDDVEVVPLHVLLTAARHGGLLLAAYRGDRMVGFTFGYRGLDDDGVPVLCSHLLAVRSSERGRGLGAALKWAQRDAALAAGLGRIVWTFDPLEHVNATLNLTRLGGVSDRYLVDLYGELRDELNAGLPTDRIEVVWHLHAPRVVARAAGGDGAEADGNLGPLLDPGGPGGAVAAPGSAARVRVRALEHAQRLRREDPDAALAWRLHLRSTLRTLFTAGYLLVGAGRGDAGAEYRLARASDVPLGPPV